MRFQLEKFPVSRVKSPVSCLELLQPVAMEKEQRFAIREGGKTVGAGVITAILK